MGNENVSLAVTPWGKVGASAGFFRDEGTTLITIMTTIARLTGLVLLMAVGYHFINEPLGFSPAGSVAVVILGACLTLVFPGYVPDARNWVGWSLIGAGCLLITAIASFSWWLLLPGALVALGFRLADLAVELPPGDGGDYGADIGGSFGGSCNGDGGGCD
jgi:hypothetical protein